MALLGFVVAPPAMLVLRKLVKRIKGLAHNQFTGTADIMETMQESLQGIRTVKAFTLEAGHARAHRRQHHRGRAQRQQDGAGFQPLQPADGNARRLRGRRRPDVWRLQRGRDGRHARPVLLVPDRVPAGLRAGQAAGAAQHRAEQQSDRRAQAAGDRRQPGQRARRRRQAGAEADRRAGRIARRDASPIGRTSRCSTA